MNFTLLRTANCLLRIPAMTLADRLEFVRAIVTAAVDRSVVN